MGDFGISFISVTELIHCKGGGRRHWAVSALMGLQKLSHWSLTCFMMQLSRNTRLSWGDAVFLSHSDSAWDRALSSRSHCDGHCYGLCPQTVSSWRWRLDFIHLCVSVPGELEAGLCLLPTLSCRLSLPYCASSSPHPLCPLHMPPRPHLCCFLACSLVHAIAHCLYLSKFSTPFWIWF